MEVTTLLVLGAAGGALRGLLDVYIRFLDWQADRRAHRRSPPEQADPPPRFADHFDPVGDSVAAVVHSAMGAGAAVLFGTTGQISGAYAALVVGISAPVILTQLGRVQSVSEALPARPPPRRPSAPARRARRRRPAPYRHPPRRPNRPGPPEPSARARPTGPARRRGPPPPYRSRRARRPEACRGTAATGPTPRPAVPTGRR